MHTYGPKSKNKTAYPMVLWMKPTNNWASNPIKPNHLIIKVSFM